MPPHPRHQVVERILCPNCNGKGGWDTWGKPCAAGSMHYKAPCATCDGSCVVSSILVKCGTCSGKGHFDTWDKACRSTSMHAKRACPMCQGRCFTSSNGGRCVPVHGGGGGRGGKLSPGAAIGLAIGAVAIGGAAIAIGGAAAHQQRERQRQGQARAQAQANARANAEAQARAQREANAQAAARAQQQQQQQAPGKRTFFIETTHGSFLSQPAPTVRTLSKPSRYSRDRSCVLSRTTACSTAATSTVPYALSLTMHNSPLVACWTNSRRGSSPARDGPRRAAWPRATLAPPILKCASRALPAHKTFSPRRSCYGACRAK